MYFKNATHKEIYLHLRQKVGGASKDCEYNSALYVLAAIWKPTYDYVEPGRIAVRELKKDSAMWSSSEKALVKLAITLFGAGAHSARIDDVFRSLDEENTKVALQALEIRYLMR